jgi:hypothetical protein
MRRSLALVTFVSAVPWIVGCASDYGSFHRKTNRELQPVPVATEDVEVVRTASDLVSAWSALGTYEGHAPTVKEAMDAAKSTCGRAGADYFILVDVPPFESRGAWYVEGICAARIAAEG